MQNLDSISPKIVYEKKSTLIHWLIIIGLFLFLGLSILANLQFLFMKLVNSASNQNSISDFDEKCLAGAGNDDKIVEICVTGVINDQAQENLIFARENMASSIIKQIDAAEADGAVNGILLVVDSPGGGVTASDIIYHRIEQFKVSNSNRFVVVLMKNLAASGGYYVSAGADKIVAHPTTITGSIGVIMSTVNFKGLADKLGIKPVIIASGANKAMLNPMGEVSPESTNLLQVIIAEMHNRFINIVANGRGLDIAKVAKLADGRIYTSSQAKALGLIDEIGYRQKALDLLKELNDKSDYKLVKYSKQSSFGNLFSINTSMKVPFSIDSKLNSPQMMYLWHPKL